MFNKIKTLIGCLTLRRERERERERRERERELSDKHWNEINLL